MSSDHSSTGTAPGRQVLRPGLPRVNLLPPEVAELDRVRGLRAGLAGAVLLSSAVVVLGTSIAAGQVTEARAGLDEASGARLRVERELGQMSSVRQVTAEVEAAEALAAAVRLGEIPWSRQLNDLSLTVPDGVWVEGITVAPATAAADAAVQSHGTITYTGRGRSHDHVARWLETLAVQPGLSDPTLASSTLDDSLAEPTVSFTSSVTVTADALRDQTEPG